MKVECPGSPVHLVNTDEFHRLTPPDSRAYFYPDTEEDCSNGTLVTLATLPPFQSLPPSSSPRPYFASPSETSLVHTASPDSSARTSSLASPSPPRLGRKRSNSEDSCSSATSTHRPRWANLNNHQVIPGPSENRLGCQNVRGCPHIMSAAGGGRWFGKC